MPKKTCTIVITRDGEDEGLVGRCDELHADSHEETYGEIMGNMKEAVEPAAGESDNTDGFNMLVVQK